MITKRKLTTAEWQALTPELKLLYVQKGDFYELPLADYEDPAELRRAKDREVEASTALRQQVATLTQENTTLKAAQQNAPDIQTLTTAHENKMTETKAQYDTRIDGLKKQHERTLKQNAADAITGAVTGTPENANTLRPHVEARIGVEWDGDKAILKVVNTDGSLGSALSPETAKSLQKEFVDNPTFAAIVVKSKASGGGAASVTAPGIGGAKPPADKKFSEYSAEERTTLFRENPEEFNRLAAADKAERKKQHTPIKIQR